MTELTLEWVDSTGAHAETIHPQQPSKNPGTVRLGRDPGRCDIVLNETSVSGLHIEIFYDASRGGYSVRSLRESNPPIINGQPLPTGELPLGSANTIQLGRLQLSAKAAMPATEVVNQNNPPASAVPPTIISPGNASPSPPPNTPAPPSAPPPIPSAPPAPQQPPPAYASATPVNHSQGGPKIWVWLIAGIVVIAGGALAIPAITNLVGGGNVEPTSGNPPQRRERDRDETSSNEDSRDDSSSSNEQDDSFQDRMSDLVTYTHENNLFTLKVPRTWKRTDNSTPGEAIVVWTDPDTGSAVLINLFRAQRRFTDNELGEIATKTLRNAYSKRPDYRLGEPEIFDDHVRVKVQFSASGGTLLGRTFVRQVKRMVSAPRIYILESQFERSQDTVQEILDSYRFFPDAELP